MDLTQTRGGRPGNFSVPLMAENNTTVTVIATVLPSPSLLVEPTKFSNMAVAMTSEKATASSHSAATSSSKPATDIGAGIGVPLGLLSLSGLGFLLWRRHGRRHKFGTAQDESDSRPDEGLWQTSQLKMTNMGLPPELSERYPGELQSKQIHEARSGF